MRWSFGAPFLRMRSDHVPYGVTLLSCSRERSVYDRE